MTLWKQTTPGNEAEVEERPSPYREPDKEAFFGLHLLHSEKSSSNLPFHQKRKQLHALYVGHHTGRNKNAGASSLVDLHISLLHKQITSPNKNTNIK